MKRVQYLFPAEKREFDMPVQVKICGITSVEQAQMVQGAGADAIGLVLYNKSSRHVELNRAVAIRDSLDCSIMIVTLMVNASADEVKQVIDLVKPDLLQFHGDESPDFCHQFDYPFIRAVRMHEELDIPRETDRYRPSGGFLFDAWHADQYGGTGSRFDWRRLPLSRDYKLILAGGLNPDNVSEAVRQVSPDMVDVSGGVESSPGVKDESKVVRFVKNAKDMVEL